MEVFYLHSFWPAFFLLIIVLLFPSENSKTSRWIDLGLFTFQPSELMRFILPISAASFLTKNLKTKMKDMWFVIFVTLICFYLVAIQPDLGTSIIILLAGLLPVIISGFPWIYIFLEDFCNTFFTFNLDKFIRLSKTKNFDLIQPRMMFTEQGI